MNSPALKYALDVMSPLLVFIVFYIISMMFNSLQQVESHLSSSTLLFFAGGISCNLNSCAMLSCHLLSKIRARSEVSLGKMLNILVLNVLGVLYCASGVTNQSMWEDHFGVMMASTMWSVLCVTFPFAFYTIYHPESLQSMDDERQALVFFGIFSPLFSVDIIFGEFCFRYKMTITILAIFALVYIAKCILKPMKLFDEMSSTWRMAHAITKHECNTASKRMNVMTSTVIAIAMLLIAYILTALKYIDMDSFLVLIVTTDTAFRLVFTVLLLDIYESPHLEVEAELCSERTSESRRKAFMKYIFHEMRIPLNSLTMAIDVLRSKLSSDDKYAVDLIDIMDCSSCFMEHALNSYITIQQIEENNFKLQENVINLEYFFHDAMDRISRELREKRRIDVIADVQESFPSEIVADEKQLFYILNNIVMHAARFTSDLIVIEVTGNQRQRRDKQEVEISVCVVGNGERIKDFEKELFYSPFGAFFTGEIEKHGLEGLSLLISKEIIKLYGGLLSVFSKDDGTVHSFQIPFAVPSTAEHADGAQISKNGREEPPRFTRNRMESSLKSAKLCDGSLYYLPRSKSGSSDSIVLDLDEMCAETEHALHSSLNAKTAKNQRYRSGKVVDNSDIKVQEGFGHFVLDIDDHVATETAKIPLLKMTTPALSPLDEKCCEKNTDNGDSESFLEIESEELSKLNVLVVDDTPCNLKMLQWLLKLNSVKSTAARNGQEAIFAFERAKPHFDLIFMDNTMPVMSGLDAVRYIRDRNFDGVVVAVTGNAMPSEVQEFLAEGADLVVTKPMNVTKLKQILKCFLGDARSSARKKVHDLFLQH